ncbi:heme A synthase [Haematospirillum jordaniae]|nr:COX15/CtaA family protein [Haematospirillum jordaniae]NKD44482.1 heme A synthase [Haematospirillum jordaniae]NKD57502.1 heme A synthase [Haematospirillum jordaniae]NKD59520.1 heme A synthase [Haematospirillum jordaniae]NKD67515.1 heme A synthase [Haematospirillum jordaniae]NKD79747.1 heme A synthase [Haematospirillum jordaniae]
MAGNHAATVEVVRNIGYRPVQIWLWSLCALVFCMVLLGGATRLTQSGLSMVEWRPLDFLPPMNDAAWEDMFLLYKASPEYTHRNVGMDLAGFKGIFWLEYVHRLVGRLVGVAVVVPLLVFVACRLVDRRVLRRILGLFVLGGLQGALGWFMVASGLIDRPDVSHYRLAAHLMLAVVLFAALLWMALDCTVSTAFSPAPNGVVRGPLLCLGMVMLTMTWGAFVAGLDAGLTYNTFPLMDGHIVPPGAWVQDPWWYNLVANVATVQFVHRSLALCTVVVTCVVAWKLWATSLSKPVCCLALALVFAVCVQLFLGITTLLLAVPVSLGIVHQAMAVVLVGLCVTLIFRLVRG